MTSSGATRRVVHTMGTVFSFDVREPGASDPAVETALDQAAALLSEIDQRFSTYREDSEISLVARGELALSDTSADVRFVLAECERYQTLTGGYFSAYAAGVLDPSGYVKGWAIERVSDLLRDAGSTNHYVNGGGDVQCVGGTGSGSDAGDAPTAGSAPSASGVMSAGSAPSASGVMSLTPWRIGIADPHDDSKIIQVVAGTDFAVATSGIAQRGAHVIDPHTGRPPSGLLSLTIVGPRITEADVLATAGFAMGGARARDWAETLANSSLGPGPGLGADPAASGSAYQAFAVTADGTTWSTF